MWLLVSDVMAKAKFMNVFNKSEALRSYYLCRKIIDSTQKKINLFFSNAKLLNH